MKEKSILLTGGTGFLGSNLLSRLIAEGYSVVLLKRSFSDTRRIQKYLPKVVTYDLDRTELEEVFQRHSIGTVFHCATNYGRKNTEPTQLVEANLILPLSLLQIAEKHGVSAFINTDTILDTRVNFYALSKGQFVDWLRTYSSRMVCVNVALEHFYGPDDDSSKFVSNLVQQMLAGVPKIDFTQGDQKREFIFIDDVVDSFLLILSQLETFKKSYFRFEVGTDQKIEIREVAKKIKKLAENEETILNFGALPYRDNEVMESQVDTTTLRKLGWSPRYSLDDGLRKTIQFERKKLKKSI